MFILQILRQSMPDLRLAAFMMSRYRSKLLAETPAIEAVHLKHSDRSPDDVAVFHRDKGLGLGPGRSMTLTARSSCLTGAWIW